MHDADRGNATPSMRHDAGLTIVKSEPFNAETPLEALQDPITPTSLHFVRSNFPIPDPVTSLVITGAVASPLTLSLDELYALPSTTLTVTVECAGNGRTGFQPLPEGEPWAGQAVGTARWTGVQLAEVLDRVQPHDDAREVVFTGADGGVYKGEPGVTFARVLALEYARDPAHDVLVAYAMNGEPLTPDHGAPLRLIVPRWYGMASVKWLRGIELLTAPFEGRFQTASYLFHWHDRLPTPVTTTQVRAIMTWPTSSTIVSIGRHSVKGKAWSGAGGSISAVEVSVDAGPWQPADVEPPLGEYGWQSWTFPWEATAAGRHTLRARAIDAAGTVQPDTAPWNRLGYANNAIQVVLVDVRAE